ncbi:MAG: hypothetical protein LBC81_03140 [Tannerellaceae bacterium]|nr:hypothetical protein [Tannerellaceae bacterium]
MKRLQYILLIAICLGCPRNSTIEKRQNNRSNIVNVHDKVQAIHTGDVFISSLSRLYTMDKYMFIADHNSPDLQIHVFDKNTFAHIASFAP